MFANRYLTVMEFKDYLGIGRTKAYKLVNADPSIPVIRIGKTILIDKEALDSVWIPNKKETLFRMR